MELASFLNLPPSILNFLWTFHDDWFILGSICISHSLLIFQVLRFMIKRSYKVIHFGHFGFLLPTYLISAPWFILSIFILQHHCRVFSTYMIVVICTLTCLDLYPTRLLANKVPTVLFIPNIVLVIPKSGYHKSLISTMQVHLKHQPLEFVRLSNLIINQYHDLVYIIKEFLDGHNKSSGSASFDARTNILLSHSVSSKSAEIK